MFIEGINPNKVYNFTIEILLDPFQKEFLEIQCQKITLPEISLDVAEHGDTNFNVKTAGRIQLTDLVVERILPMDYADTWAIKNLFLAQNPLTGSLLPFGAKGYKRNILVKEWSGNQVSIINTWYCYGCFLKKLSQNDYDRKSSELMTQTLTFSVDMMSSEAITSFFK